mgnify:FL=1
MVPRITFRTSPAMRRGVVTACFLDSLHKSSFTISVRLTLAAMLSVGGAAHAAEPRNGEGAVNLVDIRQIHLEFSATEYRAMQPPAPTFGVPGGAPAPQRGDNERETERNFFGTEFPWVEAALSIDGEIMPGAHVRYDGGITYMVSARRLKRPLALRMGNADAQSHNARTTIQLHSMPLDQSQAREAVAFSVFEATGVPVPRAEFAELTLTVPDQLDREYLGLYTLVHRVKQEFLANQFGNGEGLLMEPFGMPGIQFLGDDWTAYVGRYRPTREATGDEANRVMEFARLINQRTDEEFEERIESFVDVDAFLRFLAANALTSNLESFFALGHNY